MKVLIILIKCAHLLRAPILSPSLPECNNEAVDTLLSRGAANVNKVELE